MSAITKWIDRDVRLPDDRRKVHCWGFTFVMGSQRYREGAYLGASRCNVGRNGGRFDVEARGSMCTYVVTHWAEVVGPEAGTTEDKHDSQPCRELVIDLAVENRRLLEQNDALRITAAARDVLSERRRQIDVENWTASHDDAEHGNSSALAIAAACYALAPTMPGNPPLPPAMWPWDGQWWKPSPNQRRNLIKAGALILAEIERLDRAAIAQKGST